MTVRDPPTYSFTPTTPDALPIELQRLDARHVLHRMGLHGHTFFELILIERAGGPHRLGEETIPTESGQLFVIPPGTLHDCRALGPACEGWVLLLTHEALDGLDALSRAHSQAWPAAHPLLSAFQRRSVAPVTLLDVADRRRWLDRFEALAGELRARQGGYRHAVHAHLCLTLLDLARLVGTTPTADADVVGDHLMQVAFGFIDRRFSHPISTRDVARAVGRSVGHLTTTMRRRTGLTVGAWITERRMAEARRLLASTSLDVPTVAERTGFSDQDAFGRAFRRLHRLGPAAWRSTHRTAPPYR